VSCRKVSKACISARGSKKGGRVRARRQWVSKLSQERRLAPEGQTLACCASSGSKKLAPEFFPNPSIRPRCVSAQAPLPAAQSNQHQYERSFFRSEPVVSTPPLPRIECLSMGRRPRSQSKRSSAVPAEFILRSSTPEHALHASRVRRADYGAAQSQLDLWPCWLGLAERQSEFHIHRPSARLCIQLGCRAARCCWRSSAALRRSFESRAPLASELLHLRFNVGSRTACKEFIAVLSVSNIYSLWCSS
jgi:hypothetical protein